MTAIDRFGVRLARLLCLLACGPLALAGLAQSPIDRPARIIVALAADTARWGSVIKASGFTLE